MIRLIRLNMENCKLSKFWKTVEVTVYINQDDMCRIEYKGRVIQSYGYGCEPIQMYHFVLKEDGNDDREFDCMLEAIKYIDEVSK